MSARANQLLEAGLWLKMSGDLDGARRLFEQALKLDPDSIRARELLGHSLPEAEAMPQELRDVPVDRSDLFSVPLPRLFQDEPPAPASIPEEWWNAPPSDGMGGNTARFFVRPRPSGGGPPRRPRRFPGDHRRCRPAAAASGGRFQGDDMGESGDDFGLELSERNAGAPERLGPELPVLSARSQSRCGRGLVARPPAPSRSHRSSRGSRARAATRVPRSPPASPSVAPTGEPDRRERRRGHPRARAPSRPPAPIACLPRTPPPPPLPGLPVPRRGPSLPERRPGPASSGGPAGAEPSSPVPQWHPPAAAATAHADARDPRRRPAASGKPGDLPPEPPALEPVRLGDAREPRRATAPREAPAGPLPGAAVPRRLRAARAPSAARRRRGRRRPGAAPAGGIELPSDAWGAEGDGPTLLAPEEPAAALELLAEPRTVSGLTPLPAPRDPRSEAVRMFERARELQNLDDHSGARELLLQAQALCPELTGLSDALARSETKLQTIYESKIGKLSAVPRVRLKEDEVIWLNLDHRAGFMLAQIDGTLSFEDLFSVSGMSRLDTARILAQLLDQRVIVS